MGTSDTSSLSTRSDSLVRRVPGSPADAGGGSKAPAGAGRVAHLLERWRNSVWLPVVAKVGTVVAGMIGLAAIGGLSTLHGSGKDVSVDRAPSRAGAMEGLWLAPTEPAASASRARSPGEPPAPSGSATETPSSPASAPVDAGTGTPPAGMTRDGRVILNTASVDELTRLPGVGQKRAEAIVKLRHRLGRFRKATDLLRVRGIGVRSLRKMLPHLVVDPPAPEPADDGRPDRSPEAAGDRAPP